MHALCLASPAPLQRTLSAAGVWWQAPLHIEAGAPQLSQTDIQHLH